MGFHQDRFLRFPPVCQPISSQFVPISRVYFHSPSPAHKLQRIACTLFRDQFGANLQPPDHTAISRTSSSHERFDCSAPQSPHPQRTHCTSTALSALPTHTQRSHPQALLVHTLVGGSAHTPNDPCALSTRCPLCAIHAQTLSPHAYLLVYRLTIVTHTRSAVWSTDPCVDHDA